jgi:polyphosphate kinase
MNALLDGKTIRALYAASQAGVKIDLIIRGMCALRPGIRGLSENIRVRSIVGRLLEHSRIFWFENGATEKNDTAEVFCGSADWMPRNLYERCEAVFPVTQPDLKRRLRHEILGAYLADTVKTRLLQDDGEYIRIPLGPNPVEAQVRLMELAKCDQPTSDPRPAEAPKRPARKRAASKRAAASS